VGHHPPVIGADWQATDEKQIQKSKRRRGAWMDREANVSQFAEGFSVTAALLVANTEILRFCACNPRENGYN
jgi:hypothetical protein